MVRFVSLAMLIATASLAAAHDHWINHKRLADPQSGEWCCNHIDCAEVPAGGVRESNGGYIVAETSETIPYTRVIWKSPDGHWWRCRYLGGAKAGKTRCLIGPPPNS